MTADVLAKQFTEFVILILLENWLHLMLQIFYFVKVLGVLLLF